MPSPRTKPHLDEQSFQGLLAAAFTIQQHNDRLAGAALNARGGSNPARPAPAQPCHYCGSSLPFGQTTCQKCGTDNERPGDHLQHSWASMWEVSQHRGVGSRPDKNLASTQPHGPVKAGDNGHNPSTHSILSPATNSAAAETHPARETTRSKDELVVHNPLLDIALQPDSEHDFLPGTPPGAPRGGTPRRGSELLVPTAISGGGSTAGGGPPGGGRPDVDPPGHDELPATGAVPGSIHPSLSNLLGALRSRRADLYLGAAVLIAVVALVWPADSPQRPSLRPWERMLVAIGIAEAPEPVVHYRGDPTLKVWVDTHTALYYCPGDELYGKSPDGHFSTQREAQTDRFEPAERSACVQ